MSRPPAAAPRTGPARVLNLLAVVVTIGVPVAVTAATIHVPQDHPRIKAAVRAATSGDTVLIEPGYYFLEQGIHVTAGILIRGNTWDPSAVVVEGTGTDRVFLAETNEIVTVEYLTIKGGHRPYGYGGGIQFYETPGVVRRVIFEENEAYLGGGIAASGITVVIENCEFRNGHATAAGGAVALSCVTATLTDSEFVGNSCDGLGWPRGGGALHLNADAHVERCRFTGNHAEQGDGGAARILGATTITESVFEGNSTNWSAGAVQLIGPTTVSSCVFDSNWAGTVGGGVRTNHAAVVTASTFRCNVAMQHGGGLYASVAPPQVENCSFLSNHAGGNGGGVSYNNSTSLSYMSNCTLWGNTADAGGALHGHMAEIVADHTLAAFNAGGGAASGGIYFSCSDLFGNVGGDWTGFIGAEYANEFGNFGANPLFCDAESGDFSLQAGSPCAPPGVTACGLVGAFDVGCGSVSVESRTWGGIKTLYRDRRPR